MKDPSLTYTATDEAGNTSSVTRTVYVVDETAPTVTAALVPLGGKSYKHNKGKFTVEFSCEDGCDPDATPTATLNGVAVTNGQVVDLRLKSEKSGKSGKSDKSDKSGKSGKSGKSEKPVKIEGTSFAITVECVDASGNVGSATAEPVFAEKSKKSKKGKKSR
ncbi:MAG TPA: hypothetical protein EYQ27_07755 [Gemmatimonadetes bacterium]|nr:hypothetical protein [Gemmatimonadota bacterium]